MENNPDVDGGGAEGWALQFPNPTSPEGFRGLGFQTCCPDSTGIKGSDRGDSRQPMLVQLLAEDPVLAYRNIISIKEYRL